jgi:hypothetical protein
MKTDPPNGESRKWHQQSGRRQTTLPQGHAAASSLASKFTDRSTSIGNRRSQRVN